VLNRSKPQQVIYVARNAMHTPHRLAVATRIQVDPGHAVNGTRSKGWFAEEPCHAIVELVNEVGS
jgi:hypothetical protein